jgi:fatty acid desaturase
MTTDTLESAPKKRPLRITDFATPQELAAFTERSNARAIWLIACNWATVALVFAGVALFTNPITILVGIALLGGRQLGFAALMHDCGHGTLFANKSANHHIGQWLCAFPILSDQPRYAAGHRKHHAFAGSHDDPDLPNYDRYPISKTSFRRKIVRDLTGQTGSKALRATWRRGRAGIFGAPWKENAVGGHIIVNSLMFAALYLAGEGWLYLMWPAAYLTAYMLIARLRQVAEHGATPDLYDPDPRRNTRTTLVSWFEKPFVAPYNLNYHLEHHIHSGIPCYNLKAFHRFLVSKGVYDETHFPQGYGALLSEVVPA